MSGTDSASNNHTSPAALPKSFAHYLITASHATPEPYAHYVLVHISTRGGNEIGFIDEAFHLLWSCGGAHEGPHGQLWSVPVDVTGTRDPRALERHLVRGAFFFALGGRMSADCGDGCPPELFARHKLGADPWLTVALRAGSADHPTAYLGAEDGLVDGARVASMGTQGSPSVRRTPIQLRHSRVLRGSGDASPLNTVSLINDRGEVLCLPVKNGSAAAGVCRWLPSTDPACQPSSECRQQEGFVEAALLLVPLAALYFDSSRWMTQFTRFPLPSHGHDGAAATTRALLLRDVLMLGTHNSATHGIGVKSVISRDSPTATMNPIARKASKGQVRKWGICQHHSILKQLQLGVRYLDLRVVWRDDQPSLCGPWIAHGAYSAPLTEVLADIRAFCLPFLMNQHNDESRQSRTALSLTTAGVTEETQKGTGDQQGAAASPSPTAAAALLSWRELLVVDFQHVHLATMHHGGVPRAPFSPPERAQAAQIASYVISFLGDLIVHDDRLGDPETCTLHDLLTGQGRETGCDVGGGCVILTCSNGPVLDALRELAPHRGGIARDGFIDSPWFNKNTPDELMHHLRSMAPPGLPALRASTLHVTQAIVTPDAGAIAANFTRDDRGVNHFAAAVNAASLRWFIQSHRRQHTHSNVLLLDFATSSSISRFPTDGLWPGGAPGAAALVAHCNLRMANGMLNRSAREGAVDDEVDIETLLPLPVAVYQHLWLSR